MRCWPATAGPGGARNDLSPRWSPPPPLRSSAGQHRRDPEMIELIDTNAAGIAAEFVASRLRAGSPAMSMVMTLVIVVDEEGADDAMQVARRASHEHPARVLGV